MSKVLTAEDAKDAAGVYEDLAGFGNEEGEAETLARLRAIASGHHSVIDLSVQVACDKEVIGWKAIWRDGTWTVHAGDPTGFPFLAEAIPLYRSSAGVK